MKIMSAVKSDETLEYLTSRRSVMAQLLQEPAPSSQELDRILSAAARVPDHGKLSPWYFLVFEGEKRVRIGQKIKDIFLEDTPDASPAHIEIEETRFTRAPLVVGVISRIRKGKPPMWEQVLSSGAVCMNMVMAANASGYGAQWLTEWYAYDDRFRSYLGLDERDTIAGFIHIGTANETPDDRPRPDLDDIVTHWEEGAPLNKGDKYGADKFGIPRQGFDFSKIISD